MRMAPSRLGRLSWPPMPERRERPERAGGPSGGTPAEAALPAPAAVVFDLDGTLVDTVGTRIDAWLEALERSGLPATRERLAPLIGIDGRRLAREVARAAGRPIDEARAEEIDRLSGELFEHRNTRPRPLPGVDRIVRLLEARGIPWAIATSSRREQVARSIRALGLPREPTIVDGSHVARAKPEPDLLLLAARRLGVDPSRCWYVGDSTWDMLAARAAGMVAIGVTAGAAVDADALRRAGARLVVAGLDELARALETRAA